MWENDNTQDNTQAEPKMEVSIHFTLDGSNCTTPEGITGVLEGIQTGMALALLDLIQARIVNPSARLGAAVNDKTGMDVRVKYTA